MFCSLARLLINISALAFLQVISAGHQSEEADVPNLKQPATHLPDKNMPASSEDHSENQVPLRQANGGSTHKDASDESHKPIWERKGYKPIWERVAAASERNRMREQEISTKYENAGWKFTEDELLNARKTLPPSDINHYHKQYVRYHADRKQVATGKDHSSTSNESASSPLLHIKIIKSKPKRTFSQDKKLYDADALQKAKSTMTSKEFSSYRSKYKNYHSQRRNAIEKEKSTKRGSSSSQRGGTNEGERYKEGIGLKYLFQPANRRGKNDD